MDDKDKNYWYPGMFVFPDVEDPIVGNIEDVTVEENKEVKVDLANVCSDADNFQAAIVKSVKSVTQATGITGTQTSADVREIARFTIDGKRINQPQRGINIVKYSDGTVKKVIVK